MEITSAGMAAYERVAESIRHDIRTKALAPGEKLAGNRALADKYDVALGTLQKALRLLQDEGWLTATPSVGVFVNEPPDPTAAVASVAALAAELGQLRSEVAELRERVHKLEGP